jgi:ankyrin repeat protein
LAAQNGNKDVAELLLANKALVNVKDSSGKTPLHIASQEGHKNIAELLLVNKADVNAKANDGATPLHWAAAKGHKDVVEFLISNKADVNAKDSSYGDTALKLAVSGGFTDVAELLRQHGGQE